MERLNALAEGVSGRTFVLRKRLGNSSEKFADSLELFQEQSFDRDLVNVRTFWREMVYLCKPLPTDHIRIDLLYADECRRLIGGLYTPVGSAPYEYLLGRLLPPTASLTVMMMMMIMVMSILTFASLLCFLLLSIHILLTFHLLPLPSLSHYTLSSSVANSYAISLGVDGFRPSHLGRIGLRWSSRRDLFLSAAMLQRRAPRGSLPVIFKYSQ